MVWQDFMFASAGYPLEELREEIMAEADYQIRRLRNHPCIVLWCGCNEDIHSWKYHDSKASACIGVTPQKQTAGTAEEADGISYSLDRKEWTVNRDRYDPELYSMILRGLAARFGNGVPYIESSPASRDDAGNCPNSGNCHISAWKYALFETNGNYSAWRDHFNKVCSFNSEFCIQGPCNEKTPEIIFRAAKSLASE